MNISKDLATAIPRRNYITEIYSLGGSITASLLAGSSSRFRSRSGNININLLPTYDTQVPISASGSRVNTETQSGDTLVHIDDSLLEASRSSDPAASLHSKHQSTSGSVLLHYPNSWEGTVNWQSTNGTVKFLGDSFDLVRGGQHFVEVNRKEGTCYSEVETVSGNAVFAAGVEIPENELPNIYPIQ